VCGGNNTATNPARLWLFPCLHFLALILLYFEMERYTQIHGRRTYDGLRRGNAYAENRIILRKGLQTKLQQCTNLQILENG
jgi:hypothetical protein